MNKLETAKDKIQEAIAAMLELRGADLEEIPAWFRAEVLRQSRPKKKTTPEEALKRGRMMGTFLQFLLACEATDKTAAVTTQSGAAPQSSEGHLSASKPPEPPG